MSVPAHHLQRYELLIPYSSELRLASARKKTNTRYHIRLLKKEQQHNALLQHVLFACRCHDCGSHCGAYYYCRRG